MYSEIRSIKYIDEQRKDNAFTVNDHLNTVTFYQLR